MRTANVQYKGSKDKHYRLPRGTFRAFWHDFCNKSNKDIASIQEKVRIFAMILEMYFKT